MDYKDRDRDLDSWRKLGLAENAAFELLKRRRAAGTIPTNEQPPILPVAVPVPVPIPVHVAPKKRFHIHPLFVIFIGVVLLIHQCIAWNSYHWVWIEEVGRDKPIVVEQQLPNGSGDVTVDLAAWSTNSPFCTWRDGESILGNPARQLMCQVSQNPDGLKVRVAELTTNGVTTDWDHGPLYWSSNSYAYTYERGFWSPFFGIKKALHL